MRTTFLTAAALASALLLATGASAKAPPGGFDVCGPSACAHLDWAVAEQFWIGANSGSGSGVYRTAPRPFYILRWHWNPTDEETAYLMPSARAIRWNAGVGHASAWGTVDRSAAELVVRSAQGIEPYATPTLTRVTVGGREVREPQTYVRLLNGKPTWSLIGGRWLSVTFESASPSPWTDGSSIVRLSRTKPYVSIDGWLYKIPKDVAARARRGLALRS
jgi:hypothetical protein